MVSVGVPGTSKLKRIEIKDREPFTYCDEHKSVKSMFNILRGDELVAVCGQCFFNEVGEAQLGEAEVLNPLIDGKLDDTEMMIS